MYTFKSYLAEGSTEAAKEMEFVLVDAAGGDSGQNGVYKNLKPYAVKNGFEDPIELGKKILSNANISTRGTTRMSVSAPVSKEWRGTNTTPKTDIIIGGEKISLKKGSSQIMSGGSDEALSTFEVAVKGIGGFDKGLNQLAKDIEQGIKDLMPSHVGTQMGGASIQKKGGTVYQKTKSKQGKIADVAAGSFDKDKILKDGDDLNIRLKKQFSDLFAGNQEFKKHFVFEAMTGKVKFGGNEGTAESFLVVDFDGSANYHKVTSPNDPYVAKILPQVKPDVKFKSTAVMKKIDGKDTKTGHYRFWSTVGLGYNAAAKALKEVHDQVDNGELQYLSEGFFDAIKKAWNKFKTFLKTLFTKVKKYVTSSAQAMMDFLGIVPDITYTNKVTW